MMIFCEFAKQCEHRKETSTISSNEMVCSYGDKDTLTRFLPQCNDYNCRLFENINTNKV